MNQLYKLKKDIKQLEKELNAKTKELHQNIQRLDERVLILNSYNIEDTQEIIEDIRDVECEIGNLHLDVQYIEKYYVVFSKLKEYYNLFNKKWGDGKEYSSDDDYVSILTPEQLQGFFEDILKEKTRE